jgi:hypothetical protein
MQPCSGFDSSRSGEEAHTKETKEEIRGGCIGE